MRTYAGVSVTDNGPRERRARARGVSLVAWLLLALTGCDDAREAEPTQPAASAPAGPEAPPSAPAVADAGSSAEATLESSTGQVENVAGVTPAEGVTEAATETAAPVPERVAMVRGLPAIARARAPRASEKAASARNREGLELHKAGDFAAAQETFKAAVLADPGDLKARYNLGCALARAGEVEAALALLEQLRDAGCLECKERVLATRGDEDWAALRAHASYEPIVAGVLEGLTTVEDAATSMRAWIEDPVEQAAPGLISPRLPVYAKILCTDCDPEDAGPGGDDIKDRLRGAEAVTRWYRAVHRQAREHRGVVIGETLRCRKGCCQFKREDAKRDEDGEEQLRGNTLYVERVCFKTVDERALWLTRMTFLDGG